MLDDMEKTISMSQLIRDHERITKDIATSDTIYNIKSGRRRLLLMTKRHLESLIATAEFLARHPNWQAEFAQDDRDFAAGRARPVEEVLRELGLEDVFQSARREASRGASRRRRAKGRASSRRSRRVSA
jgi:hypothetical protein